MKLANRFIYKITCLVFVILTSCSLPSYLIVLESDLVDMDIKNKKLVPIPNHFVDSSSLFSETYSALNKRQNTKVQSILKRQQTINDEYYFVYALNYFSKKEYKKAQASLKKVENFSTPYLIQLLDADIKYEIDKMDDTIEYKQHFQNYQQLYDSYLTNDSIKKLIKLRPQQIKYFYY